MSRAFDLLVTPLIQREGGFVNDANDSGGATRYGITEAVARAFGYTGPMSELPVETARAIYKARYWDCMLLDEIEQLVPKVAEELFDSGVNCGVGKAGEWLQRALNALNQQATWYPDLVVDGRVGRMSVAALKEYIKRRGVERGQRVLLRALDSQQCVHYLELSQARQKDEAYVFGWIDNRCGAA